MSIWEATSLLISLRGLIPVTFSIGFCVYIWYSRSLNKPQVPKLFMTTNPFPLNTLPFHGPHVLKVLVFFFHWTAMINTSIHFPSSWLAGDQRKRSDVLTGGRWPEQTWHGIDRIPPQKEKHILISFYRYVARYWVVFTLAFWNSEVSSGMSLVFLLACRVFRTPDWEVLKERFSEVPFHSEAPRFSGFS